MNNDGITDNNIRTRIRFGQAVACKYHDSGNIFVIAGNNDFAGAIRALVELADQIVPDDPAVNAVVKGLQKL